MNRIFLRSARIMKQTFGYKGPKVVFIHLPKCGGSSLNNALGRKLDPFSLYKFQYEHARKSAMLTSNKTLLDTGVTDDFEQLKFLLCYLLNGNHQYLHGHFPVTEDILRHYATDYQFVTLLRDPLARWKSNYLFNKGLPDPELVRVPSINFRGTYEEEFDHVISSGMGLLMGSLTTAFLAGRYPVDKADAMALSKVAASNLKLFKAVGTLDNLPHFTEQLSAITSKQLSIGTDNKTSRLYSGSASEEYKRMQEFLSRQDITAKIKTLIQSDQVLYNAISTVQTH